MSTESWQLIGMVACAAAVYVLSVVNIVQLLLSRSNQRSIKVKQALLSAGLLGVLILGCLAFLEEAGSLPALMYAACACAGSFILFWLLTRRWRALERTRAQKLANLQTTIDNLSLSLAGSITPEAICARAAQEFDLTRREQDMLLLLSQEHTYAEISQALFLSPNTVKTHVRSLYKKINSKERAKIKQAIRELS